MMIISVEYQSRETKCNSTYTSLLQDYYNGTNVYLQTYQELDSLFSLHVHFFQMLATVRYGRRRP